jgi:hypothetical protein
MEHNKQILRNFIVLTLCANVICQLAMLAKHHRMINRDSQLPQTGISATTDHALISRRTLCTRWDCSDETLRRRERAGLLHPIHLSNRLVRYRLAEVMAVEKGANATTVITKPRCGFAAKG